MLARRTMERSHRRRKIVKVTESIKIQFDPKAASESIRPAKSQLETNDDDDDDDVMMAQVGVDGNGCGWISNKLKLCVLVNR